MLEPQYRITGRLLGHGGFGKVYMAYNMSTGQQLACKAINIEAKRHVFAQRLRHYVPKFFKHNGIRPSQFAIDGIEAWIERRVQDQIVKYDCEAKILKDLDHVSADIPVLVARANS